MLVPEDDNTNEQAAKEASEQAVLDAILNKAMQIMAGIGTARTPEEVTALINKLMELAGLAGGSNAVGQIIASAIASAQSRMSELTQAERAAIAMRIENSDFLDADTKKLYKGIDEHLTDDERMYLDKINPGEMYQIAAFDENGKLIEGQTVSVKGAEIQESFIMLKAHENKDKLTKDQRESYNMKLHGHKDEARTPEEHERDKIKLKEYIGKRQAHKYSIAETPAKKEAIRAETPIMYKEIDKLEFKPLLKATDKTTKIPPNLPQSPPSQVITQEKQENITKQSVATIDALDDFFSIQLVKSAPDPSTAVVADAMPSLSKQAKDAVIGISSDVTQAIAASPASTNLSMISKEANIELDSDFQNDQEQLQPKNINILAATKGSGNSRFS